jgi:polyisoprenoid-binding protein YceI
MSATTISTTRTAPAPGTYLLDASHTDVGFRVRHLGVGRVRGRFEDVDARLVVAGDPTASSLEVSIPLASVNTRDEQRDAHLRSADFFDVEQHPTMTYRSTSVGELADDGSFTVDGDLTVRGVTRPVRLDAVLEGALTDPWGNARFGFSATAELDREAFGLTWNQALEAGGVLVGKKVSIEIEGEAIPQA